MLRILYWTDDDYWTRSDFDLQAIESQTNRKWSVVIVNSTSGEIRVRVLDSCRVFEQDVEVYDFHYLDLAVSSTGCKRKILKILPIVDWVEFDNSLVLVHGVAIADVEAIEYYIVMLTQMLLKRVLKKLNLLKK